MPRIEIDAADVEHVSALVTGGLLLATGYQRKDALGFLLKLGGWAFLLRGQSGYRRLYDLLGITLPATPTRVGRNAALINSQIVVRRSPGDLYRIWRNLENLPVFMDHLVSVREIDDDHSQWVARAPGGMVIRWDAEIVRDYEDRLIAWRSLEGSGVDTAGSVRFDPIDEGVTLLKVRMRYNPPGSSAGAAVARMFRNDPKRQIDHDLRRFKAIVELEPRIARASVAMM